MKTALRALAERWDNEYELVLDGDRAAIAIKGGRIVETSEIPTTFPRNLRKRWFVYAEEKPKQWQQAYFEVIDTNGITRQAFWYGFEFGIPGSVEEIEVLLWREYA
jgi:hypothetical protein